VPGVSGGSIADGPLFLCYTATASSRFMSSAMSQRGPVPVQRGGVITLAGQGGAQVV
jgi:hypothetical protein